MDSLPREYYLQDTLTIAQDLLGKYLVRKVEGICLAGRITETEAYIGAIDKACHAFDGKVTPRTRTLYEKGGTSYVYLIYGMYNCMNVVTEPEGAAAAVLIRGLEMVTGVEEASRLRYGVEYEELTKQQRKNFANGPGKLCKAMGITRELNGLDLCKQPFWITEKIEGVENPTFDMGVSARIGIDYAEEAKDFPWRFFVKEQEG